MAQETKTQSSGASTSDTDSANSEIAADAYVFGYPLVLMDVTRALSTAVAKPEAARAPINQFVHMRAFPDASFTDVVSPNADTLYSAAWLDLTAEPIVLSVPEMGKRYYLLPMLDAWTNVFASPGTRTTGNGKGSFAIVGPDWNGQLPAGLTAIKSPTNMVWIIGRTQTNGKSDFAAVNAIQDQYTLIPLSAWGKSTAHPPRYPSTRTSTTRRRPPARSPRWTRRHSLVVSTRSWWPTRRAQATGPHSPDSTPSASVQARRSIQRASIRRSTPERRPGERGSPPRPRNLRGRGSTAGTFSRDLGNYDTNYLLRAIVALVGLGANLTADAIYPHATTDTTGQPLTGANKYVIRFAKDALPPVKAFWSVTMYNAKQAFVANPIDRYAIGDRDKLATGSDGSVTLYIQKDSPGKDLESNWLPAPADSFNLVMRLYWPEQAIVDGTWRPPGVERAP